MDIVLLVDDEDALGEILYENAVSLIDAIFRMAKKDALKRNLDAIAWFAGPEFEHYATIGGMDVDAARQEVWHQLQEQAWWENMPLTYPF